MWTLIQVQRVAAFYMARQGNTVCSRPTAQSKT